MNKRLQAKKHYWISTIVVLAVASLCYPFADYIGYRSVALILLLCVSVLAMQLSLYPVLLAAVLSALIWDYFFIPPHFTLSVSSTEDLLLLLMYFIVALLNGIITYKTRILDNIARQKEEKETAINLYNTLFDSLSHELRIPITTIMGASDILLENENLLSVEDKKELIKEISEAGNRLNTQIENLLNTSRLESGFIKANIEWCDVNELVFSVLNKLEGKLADYSMNLNLTPNLSLVKLDFGLMESVLYNIINNAVLYSPKGTLLSISTNIQTETTGHLEGKEDSTESLIRDNDYYTLIINITDNGPGIPIDEIQYIFNKFYRSKKTKINGSGLGLYIVKGFVEAQGGKITAKNAINSGVSFTITIPTPILTQTIHHESA